MSKLKTALQTALAFFLSALGSLASFGLILALFWSLNSNGKAYKMITSLISAALSITLGGVILAWITKYKTYALPALFGLIIGLFSLLYILGTSILVVPFTILAVALSVAGSYLYLLIFQRNPKSNSNNS